MAKRVNHGKTEQILEFIREFCAAHGFSPTIRKIGRGVGLQSTSTVAGYLSRMTRDGLITSIPGTPRSIQTAEPKRAARCLQGRKLCPALSVSFSEGDLPHERGGDGCGRR